MSFPDAFYRWRPHPWHGLKVGPDAPRIVHAYIEISPFDLIKYEIDKITGYMRVDRPQLSSSQPPTLYGFIPRTYCGDRVRDLSPKAEKGDQDPLDICVISERFLNRSEVILDARVVGALQALDGGEADDKIVAILENDPFWRNVDDIADLPEVLVNRLRHYFNTYKMIPGEPSGMSIEAVVGREQAFELITAAMEDYEEMYGG